MMDGRSKTLPICTSARGSEMGKGGRGRWEREDEGDGKGRTREMVWKDERWCEALARFLL